MKIAKLAAAALTLAVLVPVTGSAHHSYSMFDMQRTVVLDAEVVQFRWSNPHAFIRANVRSGGETELWSIEMTSPNNLVQEGWTRRSLANGDRVRIWVHPLRSGAQGGSYVGVRLANGNTLGDTE